jgi:hypothetical protein
MAQEAAERPTAGRLVELADQEPVTVAQVQAQRQAQQTVAVVVAEPITTTSAARVARA